MEIPLCLRNLEKSLEEYMIDKITRHWDDIGYTVVISPREYIVEFWVYEITGRTHDGNRSYEKDEKFPCITDNVEEADVYFQGSVKWDGCSNFHFLGQDDYLQHVCDKDGIRKISEMMLRCYDLGKEFVNNWEGDD